MNPIPELVGKLHALFAQITGRSEPLRFHERAWHDLLTAPEYEGDAERLRTDVVTVVRYLLKMNREGKRNPGALKLKNFLAVDTFLADLAEARPQRPIPPPKADAPQSRALPDGRTQNVLAPDVPGTEPLPPDIGPEIAKELRKFAESMKGGSAS